MGPGWVHVGSHATLSPKCPEVMGDQKLQEQTCCARFALRRRLAVSRSREQGEPWARGGGPAHARSGDDVTDTSEKDVEERGRGTRDRSAPGDVVQSQGCPVANESPGNLVKSELWMNN